MDRRFVLFLTLSMLVLLVNAWWSISHMPPPKPAAPAAADKDGAAAADGDPQPAAPKAADEDQPAAAAEAEDAAAADEVAAALPAEEAVPQQFVSLGSIDADSNYRMLVTFTNEGAGVRRIELANPRYLDLQDIQERIGYLGHLELKPTGGGLVVGAVGAGTPAAVAGLQVGDVITAAGFKETKAVATRDDFAEATRGKPRAEVTVEVTRSGEPQTLTMKLVRAPLDVIRPESENAALWMGSQPVAYPEPPSFLMTLSQVGTEQLDDLQEELLKKAAENGKEAPDLPAELPGVDLRTGNWRIAEQTADTVTFERRLPAAGMTIVKRYRLAEVKRPKAGDDAPADPDQPAYDLMLEVTIRNDADGEVQTAYQLDGPNGLPIEGWWYAIKVSRSGGTGLRDMIGCYFDSKAPQMIAPGKIASGDAEAFEGGSLAWAGVDAQYFSVCLIPQKTDPEQQWLDRVEGVALSPKPKARSAEGKYANVTCRLKSLPKKLAAGEEWSQEYQVFAGPKRPALLANYVPAGSKRHSLVELVYYGWFGAIANVMLAVLHFFYAIVGNYGIAIIMLTVLVRGLMFPVSRGQAKSMAKMQELKPEMDKLKEKYKGDQQKQAQMMQELYRKHGVNPLAGCLPMLIQLPVFIGLYRGLAVDIELRQAPLFGNAIRWCSNLAAPDMLLDWSSWMPSTVTKGETMLIGLGPYLNILPLVTMVLFLLQQKLFMPPAANDQAAMQQKMMKYMMVFMGLLFYKVPSGLCLYFIASSLWGIAERKLIPPATAKPALAVSSDPSRPDRSGSSRATSDRSQKRAKTKKRR
ncbi:MAG: YidC/Oxa1 family insertase periplasmic-domain containing protein [Planctomycetales bacterium]|nr:YidC/Oxa1 family insertase periplasmic-domain containing protein [Planctomycetales bacterium]